MQDLEGIGYRLRVGPYRFKSRRTILNLVTSLDMLPLSYNSSGTHVAEKVSQAMALLSGAVASQGVPLCWATIEGLCIYIFRVRQLHWTVVPFRYTSCLLGSLCRPSSLQIGGAPIS